VKRIVLDFNKKKLAQKSAAAKKIQGKVGTGVSKAGAPADAGTRVAQARE
jgi:hypothetical protein